MLLLEVKTEAQTLILFSAMAEEISLLIGRKDWIWFPKADNMR